MAFCLDEIYDLFTWKQTYTPEEYEANVAAGIEEAKKYKYIWPFIQPMIPEAGKSIWEPCARVISLKSDEELAPYFMLLFEWMQDLNWPGAKIIFDRLLQMPFSMVEREYNFCRWRAEKEKDTLWLMALDEFREKAK